MSKKSGSPSLSLKPGLNPNTPTYNPSSIRWQSTYLPTMGQLALPATNAPPGMWTPIGAPITAGYGYGYPFTQQMTRFGPPPVAPHSNYCCLANRHQCGAGSGFDHNCNNGWPSNGSSTCWNNNHREGDSHNHSPPNGVAITEVKDDSKEESDGDSSVDNDIKDKKTIKPQKKLRELKKENEELKSKLEETQQRLQQTEDTLLNLKEKMSFDCLEYYRNNLRTYGSYIRQEVNRFYQNQEMAQKLKPIVEQISNSSYHIKEEKEKTKQSLLTARQQLKDSKRPDLSANTFSAQSLPDFPDLLAFYKNILDEIPLIYLNDLSQLKRMANNFIQTRNNLSNSAANSLPMTLPFGDEPSPSLNPLPTASNSLFSAPNISDLPKPDFNTLPLKPVEPSAPPALELNFPRNSSPIPLPDSIMSDFNKDNSALLASTPLLEIMPSNKSKDKPISPIGKPIQPVIDLKAICAENVKSSLQNSAFSAFESNFLQQSAEHKFETDFVRAPTNPIPRFAKQRAAQVENDTVIAPTPIPIVVEAPKTALNQAQNRLLVKLKEKYPQISDSHLIESMAQTKTVLIASGNPKGFSGMKVADIINKISEYIDNKVLSNNFSKPRLTEMKTQTNLNSVIDQMANTSIAPSSKKGWNTVTNKTGKFDDSICSICFEPISFANKYETECQHFFHHSCINNWIRTDGSCPICRRLVLPPGEFPEL